MPKNRHIVLHYYQKSHTLLPPKKKKEEREKENRRNSLVVHGLGLRASAAWGTGSFLVRELRSCMSLAWPKKRRKRWRIHYHKLRLQYPFIGNEQIQQAENQYWQSWTQQIINQLDIIDNYKLLHPTAAEYILFLSSHGTKIQCLFSQWN